MAMHQKSEERVLRTNVVSTVLCPVDGVTMNSEAVYEKVTYKGKEYNVCSQHCLRMFKRSPDTYIK